jgi:hypothetical protein
MFFTTFFTSCIGIFVYIFSISTEHDRVFLYILPCSSEWANVLLFCMLNVFGSCKIVFSIVFRYLANLYAGLSFQLTIGHTNFYCLCNFIVPCMHRALGFILIYFHLLLVLNYIFAVIVLVCILYCCLLVMSCDNFVKLLLFIKFSLLLFYTLSLWLKCCLCLLYLLSVDYWLIFVLFVFYMYFIVFPCFNNVLAF